MSGGIRDVHESLARSDQSCCVVLSADDSAADGRHMLGCIYQFNGACVGRQWLVRSC